MPEISSETTQSQSTTSADREPFLLGPWTVIPRELRLLPTDDGSGADRQEQSAPVRLQQKEMQLLLALADQEGRPLSSEALRQAVWGDQAITDGVAKNLVWQLRKSLGESADEPDLIETVPGAGYRLRAKPSPVPEDDASSGADQGEGWHSTKADSDESTGEAAARKVTPVGVLAAFGLVAILIFVLVRTWTGSRDVSGEVGTTTAPRLVVDLPGRESDLAVDPDGRHLLFSHRGDSSAEDLYLFDFDDESETPLQLTRTETRDSASAWSPDGRRIAFTRTEPHTGLYEIHVMPATGGESRLVGSLRSARPIHLEWLDGESLVLARIPAADEPQGLEVLQLESGELTQLTRNDGGEFFDRGPALSPDGRHLAFARWRGSTSTQIAVMDLDSGEIRLVGRPMAGINGPSWLSGTDRIVFAGTESSLWRLWWLKADGSEPPEPFPATAGAMDVGEVATSRSGTVVYEQSVYDVDVLRFHVRGSGSQLEIAGEAERLVPSDRAEMAAAPHPGGRGFAFLSDRTGPAALWVSEGDGSPPRRLNVDGVTFRSHPTWSPDGSVLALSVRRGGQSDIVVVRAEDGHVELATDTPERREVLPTWRPDGLAIRFSTPSTEPDGVFDLWEQDLWRGGEGRLLVRDVLASQALSDGRLVGYRNRGDLVVVDPSLPDEVHVLPVRLLPGDLGNWHGDDEGVLWLSAGSNALRFYSFATDTTTEVAELKHQAAMEALRVSADGQSLYLSVMVRDDARIIALRP